MSKRNTITQNCADDKQMMILPPQLPGSERTNRIVSAPGKKKYVGVEDSRTKDITPNGRGSLGTDAP